MIRNKNEGMVATLTGVAMLVAGSIGYAAPAAAICLAPKYVSGEWRSNDGGTYQIRRNGDDIFWFADGPGESWQNVFAGKVDGNTITGQWADVVGARNFGTLTLNIIGESGVGIKGLKRTGSSGAGYAGERWFQQCNDT